MLVGKRALFASKKERERESGVYQIVDYNLQSSTDGRQCCFMDSTSKQNMKHSCLLKEVGGERSKSDIDSSQTATS